MSAIRLPLFAQDGDLLERPGAEDNSPVLASFKGTRLINFQTIEVPGRRTLDFRISHHFGPGFLRHIQRRGRP